MIQLTDRAIIEVSGTDRKKFLQGLVTNDVLKAGNNHLIYAVMLSAQGRFLYDFFIYEEGEKLMLDCFAARCDEIVKKLNFYKLRADVSIKKNDDLIVAHSFEEQGFKDPRHSEIGYRIYTKKQELENDASEYNFKRISLKIPDSEHDLTYDKSFILEFGFDQLNAIDYQKGCYVGQELTARTHYRGEIRKKLFHIKITDPLLAKSKSSLKEHEITCEGKSAGIILSSIIHDNQINALALIKHPEELNLEKLELSGAKIFIIS